MHIRPFEIALIGIFAVAALVGLFFLSNYNAGPSEEEKLYGESVSIWGTVDREVMQTFLLERTAENKALEVVTYTQIDPRRFESELLNAIAEGRSPDLVIMPHTLLVTYRSKLLPILPQTLSVRDFKDTYIDGAEIFMRSDGIYGLPFAVDPLVMYWNRDIFSSSGLSLPPKTWEALISQTTKAIVRTDDEHNITQSAVAFGEYANVAHAKDILATLFLQTGSDIVTEQDTNYIVTLNGKVENGLASGEAVLSFYTQFTNPSKELYSWNRSMNLDRTEFLNGKLGMYFGKGSERLSLERENSNLNFDMAPVPQGVGATTQRVYGDFYAFSILRASHNSSGSYAVAKLFSNRENSKRLADALDLVPVERGLFTEANTDPYKIITYKSALTAHGWLDPSPRESDAVFRTMIEEISSGRTRLKGVIMDTVYELEKLF